MKSGQYIKSSLLVRHLGHKLDLAVMESRRNPSGDVIADVVQAVSVNFESIIKYAMYTALNVAEDVVNDQFSMEVVRSANPYAENARQLFIKVVENPYSSEGVSNLMLIAFGQLFQNSKLPILEDHLLENYLSKISPD